MLTIEYDIDNLKGGGYTGEVVKDRYGRAIPKHAHGTANLKKYMASIKGLNLKDGATGKERNNMIGGHKA